MIKVRGGRGEPVTACRLPGSFSVEPTVPLGVHGKRWRSCRRFLELVRDVLAPLANDRSVAVREWCPTKRRLRLGSNSEPLAAGVVCYLFVGVSYPKLYPKLWCMVLSAVEPRQGSGSTGVRVMKIGVRDALVACLLSALKKLVGYRVPKIEGDGSKATLPRIAGYLCVPALVGSPWLGALSVAIHKAACHQGACYL